MVRIVTDYLDETADRYPEKIAFSDENKELTFLEVRRLAEKIATWMIVNGVFKRPVGIYLKKGVDVLVSFIGCSYSGNFYSPIDPDMPEERAKIILNTLKPEYIITCDELLDRVKDISVDASIVTLAQLFAIDEDIQAVSDRKDKIIDTDVLYVFFTSGSTGVPKGVIISHRAVIDYAEWVNKTFHIDKDDIIGNQAPFYFDNSILDIFQSLKTGAQLDIIPENLFAEPKNLLSYLNEKEISFIFWVPSALCIVANSGELHKNHLSKLHKILFCGEVMPNKQLNIWRSEYPNAMFANLYGPTEIADVCTYYIVDRQFSDDELLPIGFPCENTDIIVLNENDEFVSPNQIEKEGELCVRGSCLSYGYYQNPERTKEAFIQNPLNTSYDEIIYRTGDIVKYNSYGEIIFVGRKDFQIKIRGYRIELGEIEAAVSSIHGIEFNCCIFDDKNQIIVLVYKGSCDKKIIRKEIRKQIPRYMMPHKYVQLDDMPLNPNGKVDRVKLKKMLITDVSH